MKKQIYARLFLLVFIFPFAGFGFSQQFNALLITKTRGYHHESINTAIPAIQKLGKRHHFGVDVFQNAMKLTDNLLEKYAVIIMVNTSGDIFDDEEQAAFERFIQSGKGYVGVHAASDTEYGWEWYTKLVGYMFKIHPQIQTAMLDVVEPNFPGLEFWPKRILWTDEWYEFKEKLNPRLKYLITIDENTYDPRAQWGDNIGNGMGGFHPISWYHDYDGGRSFYTALGHMPTIYGEKKFLDHVFGGIYWAATGNGLK
jgi:type 1 glutamine amidotransferase